VVKGKIKMTLLGAQAVRSDVSELPPPSLKSIKRSHVSKRFIETRFKDMKLFLK
jgi:hypothetical protein